MFFTELHVFLHCRTGYYITILWHHIRPCTLRRSSHYNFRRSTTGHFNLTNQRQPNSAGRELPQPYSPSSPSSPHRPLHPVLWIIKVYLISFSPSSCAVQGLFNLYGWSSAKTLSPILHLELWLVHTSEGQTEWSQLINTLRVLSISCRNVMKFIDKAADRSPSCSIDKWWFFLWQHFSFIPF